MTLSESLSPDQWLRCSFYMASRMAHGIDFLGDQLSRPTISAELREILRERILNETVSLRGLCSAMATEAWLGVGEHCHVHRWFPNIHSEAFEDRSTRGQAPYPKARPFLRWDTLGRAL